jgi:tetratricopeptide (TPR) repeat protein
VAADLPPGLRELRAPWTVYFSTGNLEKALEQTRESVRLEPNSADNYGSLALAYIFLNRLDEAEIVLQASGGAQAGKRVSAGTPLQISFSKGRYGAMAQTVSAAMGKPGSEDLLLYAQANTEAWYGRLKDARELTRRAINSAQQNNAQETGADYQARMALHEVESGLREQARSEAYAAIKLAPNAGVRHCRPWRLP